MMQRPTPFDLCQWLTSNPQANITPKFNRPSQAPLPNPNRSRDAYSQARAWIARTPPAISGQGGHARTFGVCCALLKGFCLTVNEAKSLLDMWNSTCVPVWSHHDLESKLLAAEKSADLQPRGWMLDKKESPSFGNNFNQVFEEEKEAKPEEEKSHNHSGIIDDPAALAIKFMEDNKTDIGLCAYRWWNECFYRWNGTHYTALKDKKMNSYMFKYIEKEFLKKYMRDCAEVPAGDDISKIVKKKVKRSLIEDVKIGLIDIINISEDNTSEPFFLSDFPDGWRSDEVIPARNRLIHLPSFVYNSQKSYIDKSPKYFSTYSLKYNFDYNYYDGPVEPPPVWSDTLRGIWPKDQESIDCIQEFFGYFLTPCTKFQKLLMLIGQKRSGKGTIIRTLKHMLGSQNMCFPTFKSLTTPFGKQALLGKSVAVFPDARITGRTDTGDVVETLLNVSGEDDQTVPRKYLTDLTTHLTTRFLIASNELPRLTENSGALVTRAIVLVFNETFLDNEDIELESRLMPEIPAILRWSIDGWKRLYERKKFIQPESGAQMIADFLNLSSPISNFISDGIDVGTGFTSDTRSLYLGWRNWCDWNGRENPGDMSNFLRNLRAAVPKLEFGSEPFSHNGDGSSKRWARSVQGLRLKPEPEPDTPLVLVPETNGHASRDMVPF